MEGANGVDVSWLHHSNKGECQFCCLAMFRRRESNHRRSRAHLLMVLLTDSPAQKRALAGAQGGPRDSSPNLHDKPPAVPEKPASSLPFSTTPRNEASSKPSNGDTDANGHHRPHIHLPHHNHEAKDAATTTPTKTLKERSSAPTLSRKGSWLSSLKSQFSSSQQNSSPAVSPAGKPSPTVTTTEQANGTSAASIVPRDGKKNEQGLQPPASPKGSGPSFLQSALRRLSSSSGANMGKMSGSAGVCPRKVMNIDPYRERCQIAELHPGKLRRVSFCVDVEIAGHATYVDDGEDEEAALSPGRRPSLSELEKHAANKKAREHNAKLKEKAEGEALKRPHAVVETKETSEDIPSVEDKVQETPNPSAIATAAEGDQPYSTKKKEKKKRSEEERKQRKEKRRLQAVANGSIPLEITRESSSSESLSPDTSSPVRHKDRPTTDPLRIYKRCCQLRETPVLKRITEQLSQPSACDPLSYGMVLSLDFTGSRLQLPDIATLGDYLAVVPVKKLIMEDCDLTDEAVRVILAGLLAVKTPDQARFNRDLARRSIVKLHEQNGKTERLGVIEKLSLKNNPKIGRDGWRHIALFIHMSRSLKAIDLSMIKFPAKPGGISPTSNHQTHLLPKPSLPAKGSIDPGMTFGRCLMERLAGSRLEELVMAECSLNTDLVKKFVQGVRESGITRLGVAGNNLDAEGFAAVADFVRTGKCEGLDLGGNPLSDELLEILVDSLQGENNRLYALSLADCSLSPQSLKSLFPALAQLPNFRFIDLSHNRRLFSTQPNAIGLFRKYLPRMEMLKRIHLNNVAMEPEHCIALAEVLPEVHNLSHIRYVNRCQSKLELR